jgi:hypothetical protein
MIAKVDEEHHLATFIVMDGVYFCFSEFLHFYVLLLYICQEQAQPARPFGAGPPPYQD